MAGKYAVPILLATVLAGGAATATAAMAAVETQVPALRPAGHWQAVPPDTTPPNAPTNLRLSQLSPRLIRLTWDPSTDGRPDYPPHPRVIAYDIYASTSPFQLIASVPAGVLTYVDRRPPCVTVSYYVKARDSAGNVSPPSNVVTRQGHGKCDQHDEQEKQDEQDKQDKQDKQDETNKLHKFEESDHDHSDDDKQIIRADKFLHVEGANDHGGGHHWSDGGHHSGGHDFGGGPEHEEEGQEAGASGGHQPAGHAGGGHEAGGQQAGRTLPFTGAPVAAVAGVGGALLVAGVAGVLISVRRRRSTGAR